MANDKCTQAPTGQQCHREPGHDGPHFVTFTEDWECDCDAAELLKTPMTTAQFDLIPLDGGVYLSCRDDDGITDMDYDTAIQVGAALIRTALVAKEKP